MSVIDIRLQTFGGSYADNNDQVTKEYKVRTSSLSDTQDDAINAVADLPLPVGYGISTIGADILKENPLWYLVKVVYKAPLWPGYEQNPLLRPSVLNVTYEERDEAYFIDCNDTPGPQKVLNSAKQRFENFPTRKSKKGGMILEITKNYTDAPILAFEALRLTQNIDDVTIRSLIYPFEVLTFLEPTIAEIYETIGQTRYHYYTVKYRLLANVDLQIDSIEDRGFQKLITGSSPIDWLDIMSKGKRPRSAWPLDGTGQPMPNANDDPNVFQFFKYIDTVWGLDFS